MQIPALLGQLADNAPALAAAAQRAGWDTQVPGLQWTVRDLVRHTGGVHRWATDLVATGGTQFDTPAGRAVDELAGPPDGELLAWFAAGYSALVETLAAAPDDLDCAAFLPAESPRHFWVRRQSHETAIHRVDAEAALGRTPSYPADFAQDGIGELVRGFGARRRRTQLPAGRLGLDAADGPSWLLTFGGDRIHGDEAADLTGTDVTVRGRSCDLYLWLWNRRSEAVVHGDPAVAALWGQHVQVTWS